MAKAQETKNDVNLEAQKILEEAQKEAAKILEGVQKEATKILEEAKAQAEEAKAQAEQSDKEQPKVNEPDPNEELVEIELFKDGGKYKDDVIVSVNGETIQIKRGEKVKIKKKFALVLDNARKQNKKAADYMNQLSEEFKEESQRRNI